MKIAIAQINTIVGDLLGNVDKILNFAHKAHQQGATMLLTPELSLSGYSPEDLLLRPSFYQDCKKALDILMQKSRILLGDEFILIVGYPQEYHKIHYNSAMVIQAGKMIHHYQKMRLPNYMVFDEARYFHAGKQPCVFKINNIRFGLNICADIWEEEPAKIAKKAGAEILLVLNASPYHMGKQNARHQLIRERIHENQFKGIIYANLVGGQDELVFDGGSFAINQNGKITHQLPFFEEALEIIEIKKEMPVTGKIHAIPSIEEKIYNCLVLGVRDYVNKNGFKSVVLGLSGGIDSALTLCIAVDALGKDKVHCIMMPTRYTAQMSLDDSRQLIQKLGVSYYEVSIDELFNNYLTTLNPLFGQLGYHQQDITEENFQARIRGNILMGFSNKTGALVLTTGNKSENAVGYSTLYGDMAGGFNVLKDVVKTMVYKLSRYVNRNDEIIPNNIIVRPPSAELRPDQKDQDSLPAYEILDEILELYVEKENSLQQIIDLNKFKTEDIQRVVKLIDRNEYKRRQAPIGIRVTMKAFGKDRRYPVTWKSHEIN